MARSLAKPAVAQSVATSLLFVVVHFSLCPPPPRDSLFSVVLSPEFELEVKEKRSKDAAL